MYYKDNPLAVNISVQDKFFRDIDVFQLYVIVECSCWVYMSDLAFYRKCLSYSLVLNTDEVLMI